MGAAMVLALLACGCGPARAQAPVASAPAPAPAAPRCTASPHATDATLVRYDCAGTGHWARVRYSVSLPAGWEVREMEERNVTLAARQGGAGVFVQGSDQLFVPATAKDSSDFWIFAGDLLLDRVPTEPEIAGLVRDAGDEAGMRRMVTRAQSSDSALAALASMLGARDERIEVIGQMRGIEVLGGQRAGMLNEMQRVGGMTMELHGRVTVNDAVLYGIVITAPEEEYRANRALWERVIASFTIHPAGR